jgi:MMPL family
LRPVSYAEFGHGPAHVGAHGGRAHVQLAGDLAVGEAGGDERHHLTFALGERIEVGRRAGFLGPGGRHRNGLLAGQAPEDAAVTALNTSGRAVLLAGLTVCAALLGLFALPDPALYGVAVTVTLVVGLTMVASLTLLPAMLGFLGPKVLRRAERSRLAQDGRQVDQAGAFWLRWAEGLGRRPLIPGMLTLAVIVILALPVLDFRTGLLDASTDPASSTTYQAYQLLAKGFGPRFQRAPGRGRPGRQPRRPGPLRGVRRLGAQPAGRGRDRAACGRASRACTQTCPPTTRSMSP